MADKKISALTGATTPLAGTEVLPIVQTGSTVKVAVSNLTAGRNIDVLGVVGTTTNNDATAGCVGEYVSSTVTSGSVVSLTTATFTNLTSISLTAGDWDVSGVVAVTTGATTTIAYINYGISTTSSGNGALGQMGSLTTSANPAAVVDFVVSAPVTRLSLASTTTVYLVTRVSFAVSTANAYGVIRARRIR
jgi:hypothetical protein